MRLLKNYLICRKRVYCTDVKAWMEFLLPIPARVPTIASTVHAPKRITGRAGEWPPANGRRDMAAGAQRPERSAGQTDIRKPFMYLWAESGSTDRKGFYWCFEVLRAFW